MLIGYARLNPLGEIPEVLTQQLSALRAAGCQEPSFVEHRAATGEQLEAAVNLCGGGDVLVTFSLNRVGHSALAIFNLLGTLEKKKAHLLLLTHPSGGKPLDTRSVPGQYLREMAAYFWEFQLEGVAERHRAGVAAAKAEGKYKGRVPTAQRQSDKVMQMLEKQNLPPKRVAEELKISLASVYRIIKSRREAQGGN